MSASSSQRMLTLWLRRFSTDRIAKSHNKSRSKPRRPAAPLVVTGRRGNVELIVAVDDIAEQRGLSPGVALGQAVPAVPD